MLRQTIFAVLATVAAVPAFIAASSAQADEPDIVWKGCGITKKAFLAACAEEYSKVTGLQIKVSGGGATKGIAAAGDGSAHFGGTCRGCLASNGERELGLQLTIVAWDALVPVVHPENPVNSLTTAQVVGILKGTITDWSEVGGDPGPIDVLVREGEISGVGYSVRKILMGDPSAEFVDSATRYRSSGPLEQQVERKKASFGITGVSSARVREVKILAVNGVEPSPERIAEGEYPYFRPLYLAHKDLGADQRAFLDWLIGDDGQAIVAAQGTVNLDAGWRLPLGFDHWTDVENVENLAALRAAAELRLEAQGR